MSAELARCILVFDEKGHPHTADISNIIHNSVDPDSVDAALQAYFARNGLRVASEEERERHGFPRREERLDRRPTLPHKRRSG